MKAIHSALLGASLIALSAPAALADPVQITNLGTIKIEVAKQFEAAMDDYNASQDKYFVKSMPLESTITALAKLSTLYAANNAPTMMTMAQEITDFEARLYDFSGTDLQKKALPNTLNFATRDGKTLGVPVTVEAFGFLYNKAVLDQAVGGTFDPDSIKTRDDLSKLFDEIKNNTDAAPVTISPMDWSLGAHYTNVFFTNTAADLSGKLEVLAGLKAGTYDLNTDKTFGEWLDTFDLMKANNLNADSPLSPAYDDGALALATGEAGLWFQGNWAFPLLKEINPDGDYGILPVPLDNDASRPGNTSISVGVPMYYAIDASQTTPDEQAGALDFITWLFLTEAGQKHSVGEMEFIPSMRMRPSSPTTVCPRWF